MKSQIAFKHLMFRNITTKY